MFHTCSVGYKSGDLVGHFPVRKIVFEGSLVKTLKFMNGRQQIGFHQFLCAIYLSNLLGIITF